MSNFYRRDEEGMNPNVIRQVHDKRKSEAALAIAQAANYRDQLDNLLSLMDAWSLEELINHFPMTEINPLAINLSEGIVFEYIEANLDKSKTSLPQIVNVIFQKLLEHPFTRDEGILFSIRVNGNEKLKLILQISQDKISRKIGEKNSFDLDKEKARELILNYLFSYIQSIYQIISQKYYINTEDQEDREQEDQEKLEEVKEHLNVLSDISFTVEAVKTGKEQ